MSMNSGQSLVPYPWRERKKFNDSRRLISPVVKLTRTLAAIATLASPLSFLAWMWAKFAFRRYNDAWYKRGLTLFAIGVIASLVFVHNPLDIPLAWYNMLRSFGPDDPADPIQSVIRATLVALPYALILQSLHAIARTYQVEKTTNAFLQDQRPTLTMRLRKLRNMRMLRQGTNRDHGGDGYVRFGVIEGDRIPWRSSRYGMVVERAIEKMGHGVFIGSTGMGKSTLAETFTHYVLANDSAMIYLDFKADIDTLRGLSAVARDSGRPCYILDIGFGTEDTSWYDLFGWAGSPSDKASVLVECFQFAEGEGGAAFYRGIAEAWLPMQIEAAELLDLKEGEGMFDFLLDTAVPARFQHRIMELREADDPKVRAKFEQWNNEAKLVKASDLQGLRNELTKITNAAGDRLKPNSTNPNPVSIREVMENGGMVYIGIAAGINDVVVKVLGSFLFREMSILVSARSRMNKSTLRDVFFIPDEASEMEERSVLMNQLYTAARGSRVWIWPSFQSFAVWDESTQQEIQSNARNFVAFDIPAPETAEIIGSTLGDVFALKQMAQEETRQQAFQNQTIGISGDSRLEIVTDSFLRPNIELRDVPAYHAYIWFKDAPITPRKRWLGRRRVRKDEIRGDAPFVKLVPYGMVLPEKIDPSAEIRSDTPDAVESVVLPEDEAALRELGPVPRSERPSEEASPHQRPASSESESEHWYVPQEQPQGTSRPGGGSEETSSPADPVSPQRSEPDSPPPLPSFAVRGARRRKESSATDAATEVATSASAPRGSTVEASTESEPPQEASAPVEAKESAGARGDEDSLIPDPWTDDEFADDGAEQSPAPQSSQSFPEEVSQEARRSREVEVADSPPADACEPLAGEGAAPANSASVGDAAALATHTVDQGPRVDETPEDVHLPSGEDTAITFDPEAEQEEVRDSNERGGPASRKRAVASDDDGGWFV